jgi:hypothetical protein
VKAEEDAEKKGVSVSLLSFILHCCATKREGVREEG